jgi:hypothetical protein
MNGLKDHITRDTSSNTEKVQVKDWNAKSDMVLSILEMYCQKDVWTSVGDDTKFKTCKSKWDEIKRVYGGVGSMSSFNTWVALMGTALDEASLIQPQL